MSREGVSSWKKLVEFEQHKFLRRNTGNVNVWGWPSHSHNRIDIISKDDEWQDLISDIADNDSSRRVIYRHINPNNLLHPVYNSRYPVNEVSFTRYRLSSHTGLWDRTVEQAGPMPPAAWGKTASVEKYRRYMNSTAQKQST